jgi:hypothetical protein
MSSNITDTITDTNTNTMTLSERLKWLVRDPEQIQLRETYASKRAWADDMARLYVTEHQIKQRLAKTKGVKAKTGGKG